MPIRIRIGSKGKTYQAWYRYRGKYIAKTFVRRTDAQEWLVTERDSANKRPTHAKSSTTFGEVCQQWLPRYKVDVKYCTYDNARLFIQKWLEPYLGGLRMEEVTDLDLIELREKILDSGCGPRTANYALSIVSKIFNDASNPTKQWNFRLTNPVKGLKPLALELKQIPYWDADEIVRFLKTAEKEFPRDYPLYCFLLNSGARIGEACAMQWEQVDLDRSSIQIRRNMDWVRNRTENTTKNHELRTVGIVEELECVLREHFLKQGRPASDDLVFGNQEGKPRALRGIYRGSFHPCIKLAKVREITLHDLRHTFAAHYVMNGGKIYDLKKILGHRDIQMTERYAHLSSEYIQQQTAIIGFSSTGAKRARS